MLGGITVTETTDEKLETKVVFLADVSDSNIHMKDDMNKFIKEVIKSSDRNNTKFAVVMFANNVIKTVDDDKFDTNASDYLKFDANGMKTDQTNIEQALNVAAELFEQKDDPFAKGQNKKIIVLSDGLETLGDGIAAANKLSDDVMISGAYFNMVASGTSNKEVQLISINTNGKIAEGEDVTVEVVVKATRFVRNAEITIYDGDIEKTHRTDLQEGTNVFKLTYTPEIAGVNTIRATVKVDSRSDLLDGNNTLYAWYSLDAQKSLLIVDGDFSNNGKGQFEQIKNSTVVNNLAEYEIKGPISPRAFPNTLEGLLQYDQIVLMDVNFDDLPSNAGANLKRYVEEVGRGLFVSFGDNFYDINEGTYYESPIAEILPVKLTLEEERETVAMVLVVDLSSSMKKIMGGSSKSRFEVVVESVKKVLMLGATQAEQDKGEGFSDTDYVGIVCFDQDSHVALEMQQLGNEANRKEICEIVEYELRHYYYSYYLDKNGKESDIPIHKNDGDKYITQGYTRPADYSRGGTDEETGIYIKSYGTSYKWAIQSASDMLSKKNNEVTLHIKQVLMMSDGAPNDIGSGYEGIVERMAKAGTITSAISIGNDDTSQQAELTKIAEAGKGSIYVVHNASDLTEKIVEKAEEIVPELVNQKSVLPYQLSYNSSVLKGVRDYEIIGGYYSSVIKEEANLVLYVDQMKPLYAEWTYGLGKVSVYMSDLGSEEWTGVLFKDNNGITLVSNMFDAAMNRQVDSTGLDYTASRDELETTVTVNTYENVREGEHLIAQVYNSNGKLETTATFGKIAEKKYRAKIQTNKIDETYTIQLMIVDDATSKINDSTTFAVTGYYNPEYDVFSDAGKNNLTAITNNGGGEIFQSVAGVFDDVDVLFNELDGQIRVLEYDVSTPVAILILILFVCDILFRTIVLKKPKKDKAEMTDEEQAASMKGR